MRSFTRMPRVVFWVGVAALLGSPAIPAHAITYELVPVGNPGNANDPATGGLYGGVAYDYQIGKHEVTIQQYTHFLNAVATTDTYSLYNASMATDLNVAGISRSGTSGSYTYSVINNGGDSSYRPITYVSWFDAARFANWMANGQPTGAQDSTTTESGAYDLSGATSGDAPAKNVTNPNTGAAPASYIPTENEWYKAAFYSPVLNSGSGGYWDYATQSNDEPGNTIGGMTNQSNTRAGGVFAVTQSSTYSASQNYLTEVGAFRISFSAYGTFDQLGNVSEFTDTASLPNPHNPLAELKKRIGCGWECLADKLQGKLVEHVDPLHESATLGFRLAAPAAVPEPSTYAMALAGLACGGFSMWRRRKRA